MFGQDDDKNDDSTVVTATTDANADTANLEAILANDSADTPTDDTPATDTPVVSPTPTEEPIVTPEPASSPATDNSSDDKSTSPAKPADNDLLDLKKQALEELTPLVEKLDQTPEEKFNTIMMMIQATDSSNLVKVAHESALKISDEKVRAQALLDIVNEINYFTQK